MTEHISPLRLRMIEDMTVRNLSPTTQGSYIHAVKKFSLHFGRSPECLGIEDVRTYQVHLVSRGVAWATLNQVVSALRFFYGVTLARKDLPERIPYARRPKTLPVILSPEEVACFLEAVEKRRDRVALTTAYATGLRAKEVVSVRIQDIDRSRMLIHVVNGKGGKQRFVMLSPILHGILRAYWKIERPCQWLFPGQGGMKPLDPCALNVACRAAVQAAGLRKRATVHALRHAFATHLLEQGTGYPHYPGLAWSQPPFDYGTLCECVDEYHRRGTQPAGSFDAQGAGDTVSGRQKTVELTRLKCKSLDLIGHY